MLAANEDFQEVSPQSLKKAAASSSPPPRNTTPANGSCKHMNGNGDHDFSSSNGGVLHDDNHHHTTNNHHHHAHRSMNGPDHMAPAESVWTTKPDGAVKVRMGSDASLDGLPAESVITWFDKTVEACAAAPAMKIKRDGKWLTWSYADYQRDVRTAAKAFIKAGLEPYHAVGIMGFNSPEWFISDIGAIYAGGIAVGIYTTNSPEACLFNAQDSHMNVIVVEDDKQLQKILSIRDQLPELKAIVQYIGQPAQSHPDVYSWTEFLALSADIPDERLAERHRDIAPNKCCTIIYTSGTTGHPKGAMLSHDNFIWTSKMVMKCALESKDEVFISYLPLSHVAAQMTDLYLPISSGGVVYFAQPDALKGTLVDTLKDARPTGFIGVPRVWEKMEEKMKAVSRGNSSTKQWIAKWAKSIGLRGNLSRLQGEDVPFGWTIASALVFKKVRQALGLDRCRLTCSGAAPIRRETQDFFLSLDIPIYDIYGMSECSGPHTVNLPGAFKLGSAGKTLFGVRTQISNPDAEGNGEICMYGRHVFMGYLGLEDKTKEALDEHSYLRTGDIGKVDADGYLFITGRLKEILITAGGENIPPVAIEDTVKEHLPIVSHAMLIGDKRKFLSILLTLKTDIDLNSGDPINTLTRPTQEWIKEATGVEVKTVEEARALEPLKKAIQKGMDEVNKKATSRAQVVQKFEILPTDFSIPGGELGPTMKTMRPKVMKKYEELIESLYPEVLDD
ncbi:Long-chain-fatty-acid--CoA ligase ACSBG2 [Hypsibius exemplaris]|uniref:long-chain-fatty-acid--CoA ligase n=1 Tax=Hypsibius exemplaris TaxID=2072580 RepID=A0A1W0X9L6_HYPEX|nr:Long-chain-fatty-acid--CoA ligase ACSBG2 [Hypsibius exemplaris]